MNHIEGMDVTIAYLMFGRKSEVFIEENTAI